MRRSRNIRSHFFSGRKNWMRDFDTLLCRWGRLADIERGANNLMIGCWESTRCHYRPTYSCQQLWQMLSSFQTSLSFRTSSKSVRKSILKIPPHLNLCHYTTRGVATGVYRYIYPPKISSWKLFCALIAADVVRLLVYTSVVSCSKKIIPTQNEFLATPLYTTLWSSGAFD